MCQGWREAQDSHVRISPEAAVLTRAVLTRAPDRQSYIIQGANRRSKKGIGKKQEREGGIDKVKEEEGWKEKRKTWYGRQVREIRRVLRVRHLH